MSFVLVLIGLLGGVLSGMGMGGGTLLIPLLSFFVDQHFAQAINLVVFIPACVIALIIHCKNKLVDFKLGLMLGVFSAITAFGGACLANVIDDEVLAKIYGAFLVLLSVYLFICVFKKKKTKEIKD